MSQTDVKRIVRAMDFIEKNLEVPCTIGQIASAAFSSERQLQRDFDRCLGDSIKGFLQKRRLSAAAVQLNQGAGILDTALAFQFNSQEAFTRAFKRQFHQPPRRFSKLDASELPHYKMPLTIEQIEVLVNQVCFTPIIHTLKFNYAAVHFNVANFAAAWLRPNQHIIKQVRQANQLLAQSNLAVEKTFQAQLATKRLAVSERKQPGEMSIDVYREITNESLVDDALVIGSVDHTYACFTMNAPMQYNSLLLNHIFATWLPNSEYRLAMGPMLSKYQTQGNVKIEVCIPIAPIKHASGWR